jgi:hypothetical protein
MSCVAGAAAVLVAVARSARRLSRQPIVNASEAASAMRTKMVITP